MNSSMLFRAEVFADFSSEPILIPVIISLLYGGIVSLGIALLFFYTGRYIIGGSSPDAALIVIFIVVCVVSLARSGFMRWQPYQRLLIALGLVVMAEYISRMYQAALQSREGLLGAFTFSPNLALYLVAMTLIVLFMEMVIKSKQSQEQMLASEKMSAAGQLASAFAHELRSPLTVVRGYLQLALRGLEGEDKRFIHLSMSELNHAEYVIHDFLNFARPQVEKVEDVLICDVLAQIQESMSPLVVLHEVDLNMECEENLWIRADQLKVRQALSRIIENAIEAAGGGQVRIKGYRESEYICLSICDNGKGMSKKELEKLGTPFYSTKWKGTGLGLTVSFRIIQAIFGHWSYMSKKGKGTKTIVRLPPRPAAEAPCAESSIL
ncbi:ATP-binding protein [Paenibacillus sp. GCM10012307]